MRPTSPMFPDYLESALLAARAAARVHRRFLGQVRTAQAQRKGRSDFVSLVDLEAQAAALEVIASRHPGEAILPEEEDGRTRPATGAVQGALWVVDPLDGTTNFLHGHPAFVASVGLWIDGVGEAGAVVAAATGEEWTAARGRGAYRNGEQIRVSSPCTLEDALVGTGFPFKHPEELPRYVRELERMLLRSAGVRRGGSAALDLCYLAQGSLDAFWEGTLAPWDVAAGLILLSEAGGLAHRRDGTPIDPWTSGSVIGANSAELAHAVTAVLDDGRPPN